jgi:hypothetical protein
MVERAVLNTILDHLRFLYALPFLQNFQIEMVDRAALNTILDRLPL